MLWLTILFLIVCAALVAVILLQNRSAGLGAAFGGASEGFHIRRGSEKTLHRLTLILAALFIILAAAHLFVT